MTHGLETMKALNDQASAAATSNQDVRSRLTKTFYRFNSNTSLSSGVRAETLRRIKEAIKMLEAAENAASDLLADLEQLE